MPQTRRSIVLTIFSTASGIGKTLVAVNLAAGIAKDGFAVCILDLDLQFGDVCNYLKLQPTKTIADAERELAKNPEGFDARQMLTEYKHDDVAFSVLAPPAIPNESYGVEAKTVINLIDALNYFDFIVIDTIATFSELNLNIMDISTIVTYLCAGNFVPVIKNLKNGYDTILRFGYDENKVRPVLNGSDRASNISLHDVESLMGTSFQWRLPHDADSVRKSIESGCPLVLSDKTTPLGKALWDMAGRYTNRQEAEKPQEENKTWFKKLFG